MTYLFPRSITLIFRQSSDLSPLLTILATDTCLVPRARMKHDADNSKACHKNRRVLKVTQITRNSLHYYLPVIISSYPREDLPT